MLILAPPSADYSTVLNGLFRVNASPLFRDIMAPALWQAARRYSVDPVGVIAQSGKETAWGRFGGRIDARWFNTCGLKIRDIRIVPGSDKDGDLPLCHQSFGSWEIGSQAHVEHLVAYAGGYVQYPVDPRYVWVAGRSPVRHFSELGGKWAPHPDYGVDLERIAADLIA